MEPYTIELEPYDVITDEILEAQREIKYNIILPIFEQYKVYTIKLTNGVTKNILHRPMIQKIVLLTNDAPIKSISIRNWPYDMSFSLEGVPINYKYNDKLYTYICKTKMYIIPSRLLTHLEFNKLKVTVIYHNTNDNSENFI